MRGVSLGGGSLVSKNYCRAYEELPFDHDPNHVYGFWHLLPDLLLEKIFQFLTIRERYYASQVCRSWYFAFHNPRVWAVFVLHDELLTKRKYNYYAGWQKLLDHFRVSVFLSRKGEFIKTLIFQPMYNLFNLYEFLNISYYMHHNAPGVLDKVHTLRFRFSCRLAQSSAEELVFGTGGQLLEMLKKVLGMLVELKTLELRDLLLEGGEGLQLLDEVCDVCCETLETLSLINITKMGHTLLHPGTFINLHTLYISPQNLGEDLLELIGNTSLRDMHIVQNKYTEQGRILHYSAWKKCRECNPKLRVHLSSEGSCRREILWQPRAPVRSIVYNSPFAKVSTRVVLQLLDYYKHDLEVYGHFTLPRFHMPRSFIDRLDATLVLLLRQCPYIHTLADWPLNPEWTPEFYHWLCKNARSYDLMEMEVSQILGYRWQALSDKQFKLLQINLNKPIFMYS